MNSGKQAVVVMSCENEHMPDDLIMEPGLVMIFAHGVEWPKMYELFIGVFFVLLFTAYKWDHYIFNFYFIMMTFFYDVCDCLYFIFNFLIAEWATICDILWLMEL